MGLRSSVSQLPPEIKTELDKRLLQSGFSNYEGLAGWLQEQGYQLSKSSVHRYGRRFEERCEALRTASQQALQMKELMGDDEAALAEMSLQLAQGLIFDLMLERGEDLEPKEIGLLTRALADSSRSGIAVKKFQAEIKSKLDAAFAKVEAENREKKTLDRATLTRIREEVYGIF